MILYGNNLIKQIRKDFDNASSRIWIMVPFIGEWTEVKKIMGTKWISNHNLNMKIITDIRNEEFINSETIKQFLHKAEVKTLPGLHAKIYIIDNSLFLTSANLTGTAFSRRYEICEYCAINNDHDILTVYNDWWNKSKNVPIDWQPTKNKNTKSDSEIGNSSGLKKLWNLPESSIKVTNFKDYQDNILQYDHLLKVYFGDRVRLMTSLTKYHELDSFLNYLYHEDKNTPSYKYLDNEFRRLSESQRISEVKKYKERFKKWLINNTTYGDYRIDRILIVQNKLSPSNIKSLSRETLKLVIGSLHTMNSHGLNKYKFLNPQNNDLRNIRNSFNDLLHGSATIEERMELCNKSLKSFGKSSIRELVSWYYPEDLPIMNRNTNSGLKFLGYDIKTY